MTQIYILDNKCFKHTSVAPAAGCSVVSWFWFEGHSVVSGRDADAYETTNCVKKKEANPYVNGDQQAHSYHHTNSQTMNMSTIA